VTSRAVDGFLTAAYWTRDDSDRQTSELLVFVSVEVSLSETSDEGEEAQTDSEDVGEVSVVLCAVSHGDVDE
jgi:hypothetical protein